MATAGMAVLAALRPERAATPQFETTQADIFSPYKQKTVRAELTYETRWLVERQVWRRYLCCLRELEGQP